MDNQGFCLDWSLFKWLDWVLGYNWACVGIGCLRLSILVVSERCLCIQLRSHFIRLACCVVIVKHTVSVAVRISLLHILRWLGRELTSDLVCEWWAVWHYMIWCFLILAYRWLFSLVSLRLSLSDLKKSLCILGGSISKISFILMFIWERWQINLKARWSCSWYSGWLLLANQVCACNCDWSFDRFYIRDFWLAHFVNLWLWTCLQRFGMLSTR